MLAASHLARGDGRLECHLPCGCTDRCSHIRVAAPLARRQLDLERGARWQALRHSDCVRLLCGRVGELHVRAGRGVERDRKGDEAHPGAPSRAARDNAEPQNSRGSRDGRLEGLGFELSSLPEVPRGDPSGPTKSQRGGRYHRDE